MAIIISSLCRLSLTRTRTFLGIEEQFVGCIGDQTEVGPVTRQSPSFATLYDAHTEAMMATSRTESAAKDSDYDSNVLHLYQGGTISAMILGAVRQQTRDTRRGDLAKSTRTRQPHCSTARSSHQRETCPDVAPATSLSGHLGVPSRAKLFGIPLSRQ